MLKGHAGRGIKIGTVAHADLENLQLNNALVKPSLAFSLRMVSRRPNIVAGHKAMQMEGFRSGNT